MSRVAASLQYLVIYNATLQPPESTPADDEDAHEQAQILFYTASERAVSRDRMLRQVGLARALVSFTETFASGASCDNVHAQGKRLIMVSPEPEFWLHASVAVARTPRPVKSKAGESSSPLTQPMQYHEHSVHDTALRDHLLRGYEDFKLMHGTFSSIIAQANGRQTLERLLERFFTVWAWAWDVESSETLRDHLGVPTHPLAKALSHTVEEYCSQLPEELIALVVTSSHVVPTGSAARMPQSLLRHLMYMSPAPTPNSVTKAASTRRSRIGPKPSSTKGGGTLGFFNTLHMPSMSVGSMDVTKWNWSGYLTFGAGSKADSTNAATAEKASSNKPQTTISVTSANGETVPVPGDALASRVEVHSEIDTKSLSDALNEDSEDSPQDHQLEETTQGLQQQQFNVAPGLQSETTMDTNILPTAVPQRPPESTVEPPTVPVVDTSASQPGTTAGLPTVSERLPESALEPPTLPAVETSAPPPSPDDLVTSPVDTAPPHIEFSSFTVQLPEQLDSTKSSSLIRRKVYHLNSHGFTVAVIPPPTAQLNGLPFVDGEQGDMTNLTMRTSSLLQELKIIVDRESKAIPSTSKSSSSAQPTQHVLALKNGLTVQGSSGFASTSPYLFECEHLIDVDVETEEVFSRTTNPARWYVAHRIAEGELYLENSRKEASLVDVDDEVTTLRRRYAA